MYSRLISKKTEIKMELGRGPMQDPRSKAYLIARLAQLDRDIATLSFFSETEIKFNGINSGSEHNGEFGHRQVSRPLPSWQDNHRQNAKLQNNGENKVMAIAKKWKLGMRPCKQP